MSSINICEQDQVEHSFLALLVKLLKLQKKGDYLEECMCSTAEIQFLSIGTRTLFKTC